MTEQYPSAPGSPEQAPWGSPTPQQRGASEPTVHQAGAVHDPWNRDSVTTPTPGPAAYPQYPQPTAYDPAAGQPYNAPAGYAQQPYGSAQPHDGGTAQQPYVQGGYPQHDPAAGHYDTLGPAEPFPKRPRGRRRTILVSAGVVVLLALGVGAYAAVRVWTGAGNAEPEVAMPASVGAFARIDLNPGVRDKLAFDDLVKKFPTGQSTSDLLTSVEQDAASSLGLDYSTDVAPWFDGRIGVGEWTDHSGQPVALLDFASKNDSAAKTALAKVQAKEGADQFGYVVENGYVLVAGADSGAQAEAVQAAADAQKSSLSDNDQFKSAVGHLSGNNLLVAYVDLHALGSLVGSALGGDLGDGNPLSGLLGSGSTDLSQLNGTVVIGASIVDDGVEIRAHVSGTAGTSGTSSDARAALDALPETTMVGLAFDGLDPNSANAGTLSQMITGLLTGRVDDDTAQSLGQAATSLLTSKVITLALTGLGGGLPSLLVSADTRSSDDAASIKAAIDQLLQGASTTGLQVTQNGTHIQATFGNAGTGHLGDDSLYKETMSGMNNVQAALYVNLQTLFSAAQGVIPQSEMADVAPLKAIGLSASSSSGGGDLLIRIIIK